jgi:hypothetical protein
MTVLNITDYQRNVKSKSEWGSTSRLLEWLLSKSQKAASAGEDEQEGSLVHCPWHVSGKQYRESSKH